MIWSGCASVIDGYVEEVHTREEAEYVNFHHSLYFTEEAVERMDAEESIFFWIQNGKVMTIQDFRDEDREIEEKIEKSLKSQNLI